MQNETIESAYQSFCRTRFSLPTMADILSFETRFGLSLPNDYRQFLGEFNGGVFSDPDIVVTDPDCPEDCLTLLYGLSVVPPSADLARPANIAIFGPAGTREVLPIGYTLMGNLLYVLLAGPERGTIGLKQASSDNYFQLAKGIEVFFEHLRVSS